MILQEIVSRKREEVAALRASASYTEIEKLAMDAEAPRHFTEALRARRQATPAAGEPDMRLIAEVKRKSPSRGVFRANLDAAETARAYEAAGAACISVLTDEYFFMGTLGDLRATRAASRLPILRKDFTIDAAQIIEARAAGADAILLIAAILRDSQLAELDSLASAWGMAALIEVHDADELKRVLPLRPTLVGINNRDLRTFRTDLSTTERLAAHLPDECVIVAESGIHTRADVERVQRAGATAILVGESLILAESIAMQVKLLLGKA